MHFILKFFPIAAFHPKHIQSLRRVHCLDCQRVRVPCRRVQGGRGPTAAAHVQGELREPGSPTQGGGRHSGQDHRGLLDHGRICKLHHVKRCRTDNLNPGGEKKKKTKHSSSSLLLPLRQVSAEPDGSSYVFQGFIQGKDYGQFGLQRLGNCRPFQINALQPGGLLFSLMKRRPSVSVSFLRRGVASSPPVLTQHRR